MLKMSIKYFTASYNNQINKGIEDALNLIQTLLKKSSESSIKVYFEGATVTFQLSKYKEAVSLYLGSSKSITVQKGWYKPFSSAIGGYEKGKIYSNWRILKNYSFPARCGHYCHEGIHSLGEIGRHSFEWDAIRKYSASYFIGYFVKYCLERNNQNVKLEDFLSHLRDKIK